MKKNNSARKYKEYSIFVLLLATCSIYSTAFKSYKGGPRPPWVAPAAAAGVANPLKGNAEATEAGKKTYTTYCVVCHGNKGKGDGIAASGLQVQPADHTSAKVQGQSDGALFWKMTEGRSPMPPYKGVLSETQRWQLVNYIRTLAKH